MNSLSAHLRSLRRTPRLTAAIVACIAISVGGAGTVLTFLWGILWRPLPFPEAARLVMVDPPLAEPAARPYLSYPDFAEFRAAAGSYELLAGATVSRLVIETGAGAERVRGETVTPGYFELLGIAAERGRLFDAGEYAGRSEPAIVLSHRFWRTRLAADPNLVGGTLRTRAGMKTVVGILPEGFLGIAEDDGTDYWLAERQNNHPAMLEARGDPTTLVVGRLRRDTARAAAEAELRGFLDGIERLHPARHSGSGEESYPRAGTRLTPLAEKWRGALRPGLVTLFVGALFLLLIGSGNVAMLLLARVVARERELSVRQSLGATRRDLVRRELGESLLLASIGGGLGLLLAVALQRLFENVGGTALPTHLPVEFGWAPLALSLVLMFVTGLLFGVAPSWVASRVDPATVLRAGGRGAVTSAFQSRGGRWLVIGQTTLAVVLLAAAALFVKSYDRLRHVDFGFRTDALLRYQVSLDRESYTTPEAIATFYRDLAGDLDGLAGVRRFAYFGPTLPPYDATRTTVRLSGGDASGLVVDQSFATREAFEILEVPLVHGRVFGPEDRRGGRPVALVSRALARRLAGGAAEESVLGRSLIGASGASGASGVVDGAGGAGVEIIGVVADARWNGQRNRAPTGLNVFLSFDQFPQASVGVLFDCAVDPSSLIDPVRKVVVAREPSAALHWIDTMDEALDFQTAGERFWAVLAGAYAATAFVLAALGLYGVLAHGVASRVREIGVRVALGATAGSVVRMIVRQGLRLVATGLALGLVGALAVGGLIQSRLYGVAARDPWVFVAVAAILLITATGVCLLPAWRAARIEPSQALRGE